MSGVDKLRARFEALRKQRAIIKVPEWDMDIYVNPLTVSEAQALSSLSTASEDLLALVDILKARARDENGELLFADADRQDIADLAEPKVLARIIEDMVKDVNEAFGQETEGFLAKSSEGTKN